MITPQKRKGTDNYQLIIKVPVDLQPVYGKTQIRESLQTPIYKEACHRLKIRQGQIEDEFQTHRDRIKGVAHYSKDELKSWAPIAADGLEIYVGPTWIRQAEEKPKTLPELRAELAAAPRTARQSALDYIRWNELHISEDSDNFRYFTACICNYLTDRINLDIRIVYGQAQVAPIVVREPGTIVQIPEPDPNEMEDDSNLGGAGPITLGQVIDQYKTDGDVKFFNKSTKTKLAYEDTFKLLARLFGEDVLVHRLTPPHLRKFRQLINHIPPRALKMTGDIQGIANDHRQAIAAWHALPEKERDKVPAPKVLADDSKNRHISATRGLFDFIRKSWHVKENPALCLTLFNDGERGLTKVPFTVSDLEKMFNTPAIHRDNRNSCYFWIPLIALHTGARRNELCQLAPGDVVKGEDGKTWCFSLVDTEASQTLKTEGARRMVPIHSMLIREGFMDFVDRNSSNENGRIWSVLTWTDINKWSGKFDKTFHRRLSDNIERYTDTTAKSFHSFRHFVTDRLKDALIDPGIIDALLGWTSEERNVAMRDYYGNKQTQTFEALVTAVESLDYPWLKL